MEEETVKYEPQCSSCVRFISDKSSSYVSSCGHLFCEKCFTSNDECPVCHERCDFLNLEDTNEYPDLHNCIYGTIKNHMDKMRELYHVSCLCSRWSESAHKFDKTFSSSNRRNKRQQSTNSWIKTRRYRVFELSN